METIDSCNRNNDGTSINCANCIKNTIAEHKTLSNFNACSMALVSTPTFVFSSYKDLFISLSLFIISSILGYFFMGICNAVDVDTVFNILVPYLNYYDFVNTFYNDFVNRNIIHD